MINNPINNKNYPINSKIGQRILKNYIKNYQKGSNVLRKNKTWELIDSIGFEFETGGLTPIVIENGKTFRYSGSYPRPRPAYGSVVLRSWSQCL